MIKNQNNILIFRIAIIVSGILVLVGYLHLNEHSNYDLFQQTIIEKKELAEKLSQKYSASILRNKLNQQKLINKIIPIDGVVVADSVIKDYYQKGNKVFVLLQINNSSQNIYAKLECDKSVIVEYFKLKSNKVFAVFKPNQILYNETFCESEQMLGDPLVLSGKNEILIKGNCLELVESPNCMVDG